MCCFYVLIWRFNGPFNMTNADELKPMKLDKHYRVLERIFGGVALSALLVAAPAFADTKTPPLPDSARALPVSYAPMLPVHQTSTPLPKSRPDPAFAYSAEQVSITLPKPRPKFVDILPKSTMTIAEMFDQLAQLNSDDTNNISSSDIGPSDIGPNHENMAQTSLKLRSGEGIAALLQRAGYKPNAIANALQSMTGKADLRRLQIGTSFDIAANGFRFSIKSGRDIYVLNHPVTGWLALTAIRPVDTFLNFSKGVINGSIYQSAIKQGVSEAAFNEYVRVMGFSVDFQREIRRGDSFEMLYETDRDRITGDIVGSRLYYAGLLLSGEQLGFFRFDGTENTIGWYDENGNSAARTLIRTPISEARLSSSFGSRRHPVSGYNALHKGVDFAAPRGTPIIAAGSGVVREAGWKGSFGRYIRIRHNATYQTAYAHMTRIAAHISPGARVAQGEIIGYVGSTGRSTGAHLHYEILVNNRQVDPMTVRLPTGARIDQQYLTAFNDAVKRIDNELLDRGTTRFASIPLASTAQ